MTFIPVGNPKEMNALPFITIYKYIYLFILNFHGFYEAYFIFEIDRRKIFLLKTILIFTQVFIPLFLNEEIGTETHYVSNINVAD